MQLKDEHAANQREPERQTLVLSRAQADVSVHSSPLLGELQRT